MRMILSIVAFLLIVSFGIGEGLWKGRWSSTEVLDNAGKRIDTVPKTIGEWESTDRELSAGEIALAELKGHLMRTYTRRSTNDVVSILLVCGKPGPISVHTPDICFKGIGLKMAMDARPLDISVGNDLSAQFWATRFEKPNVPGEQYNVLWGWSTDGKWVAANNPRVSFGLEAVLNKLYVIRPLGVKDVPVNEDKLIEEFLALLIPAVNTSLFAKE